MALQNFVRELRSRGVYQVAAVYAAAAWALLQVADVVFPLVGLPDKAITIFLVIAAVCFPVALILAWLLDWTPSGIRVSSPDTLPDRSGSGRLRLVEFAVLVVLVGLVGYLYWERLVLTEVLSNVESTLELAAVPGEATGSSIAVLPFATMSDRAEDSYFGDGLAEEILNLLAKLDELDVAARTSSFAFRGEQTDIRAIAEKLAVRHILEGSVRRAGNQIRVTAQLIDANSGYHLWSETYERRFEDIFRIQDDIARQVANALELIISRDNAEYPVSRPTDNLESYDYYLRAKNYLRRPAGEVTLDSALSLLGRSIELDPGFANARAASCTAYLIYYQMKRSGEYFKQAEKACYAALALNDEDAEVYSALGNLYLVSGQTELAAVQFRRSGTLDPQGIDAPLGLIEIDVLAGDYQAAEAALDALLANQPNVWRVHLALGNLLFSSGRAAEAAAAYRRATELSPDNQAAYNGLGGALFMQGDFSEAAAAWSESLAREPTAMAFSNTGSSLFYMGEYQQAANMYNKAVELAPLDYEHWGNLGDAQFAAGLPQASQSSYRRAIRLVLESLDINAADADATALLAHYYAAAGEPDAALEFAGKALQLAPNNMYVHYDVAIAYARLGRDDKAVEIIRRAVELGYPPGLLAVDPSFSELEEVGAWQLASEALH